jgi:hypothetical protein
MFSKCHGTHDRSKIFKIAFQDNFVISGSFSPQCARFRLPSLIAQHAKLKCRSDDPRNHSKWGAVNYCFFRHGVNEFGCKLLGRYASKKNNAVRDVWFLSENKIREWTALSMPTLSMHNYCLSTKCWYATAGNRPTPLPRQQWYHPYQCMLTETVDRNSRPIHVPFRWAMLYGKYTPTGSCKPANYQNWATNYHKEK